MAEGTQVTFAVLLKQLRKDAGLSQEELAGAAEVSTRTISDLERGVAVTPRKATVQLLADALRLAGPTRARFEAVAQGRSFANGLSAPSIRVESVAAATRALPRDLASFTGRESELQQLIDQVDSGGVVGIHAIGGMAGIGKTAFAVRAAYQLADRFPDGQIFLSLHGHTPGHHPVEPADALASLLQISGVAAQQIPQSVEARAALWRDRLADKKLLLLLDDATGHEQVRQLLPGTSGSLVLITSRRHLAALEDARQISLDTLTPDEAVGLLVRLAARSGLDPSNAAVGEITKLCGYLPLAIAMLARQLHHHPTWSAADLATDLTASRDRLALMESENLSVTAAFDLSYRDLTAYQQKLFRHLGLNPGIDIDIYSATALAGIDLATARGGLHALYDQYLLAEPARGRYRLHDLIREHARALAGHEPLKERDAAISRLLDYYLHVTHVANRHLAWQLPAHELPFTASRPTDTPDLPTRSDALAWMEAERHNLHAAISYAARDERVNYAVAMSTAMHAFLRVCGYWDQALVLHDIALWAARGVNDQRAEAAVLDDLGVIQRLTGNRHEATVSLVRALELYRIVSDLAGEARVLVHLGRVQYLTDEYDAADTSYTQALALYRSLGDLHGEADSLHGLGIVQRLMANFSASAESLTRALALYRSLNDLDGEADALENLGTLLYMKDEYPKAAAALRQALELYRSRVNRNGEANALRSLGVVQCKMGDYLAAMSSQEMALGLYRSLGNRFGEANSYYELGIIQRSTADYAGSAANLARALQLYRALRDRLSEANALTDLGVVQRLTGDFPNAAEGLARALHMYRALREPIGEAETLNNLGELSLEMAKPSDARVWHDQALEIARRVHTALEEARALEGIGRCHLYAGEPALAAALLREALAIYQRLGSPNAEGVETILSDHNL